MMVSKFHKRNVGFTLIELMIGVAIVGILAAIALPGYSQYITKANRTDAMNFLLEVSGEQQKYFSENNVYAGTMADLGYATETSPESHYTLSITSGAAGLRYGISATPVAGGRQAKDDECSVFTIDSSGVKANTGGTNAKCW